MSDGMICTVCQKNKYRVTSRKSSLIESMTLDLCDTCLKGKFEPRWAIVLVARTNGIDAVSGYVANNRYVGRPIMLSELT